MKLTLLLSIITLCQAWATETYSQMARLTMNLENTKIADALRKIEDQSEFYFLYSPKQIDVERKVNINVKDAPINSILSQIFTDDIKFIVSDRQIVLTPSKRSSEITDVLMQQYSVSGKITDASTGEAMPGVNIQVKGTSLGTISGANGTYSLNVPDRNATLVFSFIGFISQEVALNGKEILDVSLTSDLASLEEVVVIGYGTQKKVDLTGVVAVVKGDELKNRSTSTASQSMQGRVSGVNFTAGSNGFEPGSSLSLQIRGQGNPLVLIDGVPGSLDRLNPNDVESMSILKDAAAAAIYGAQAAYGVVLITTKSGTKDERIHIDYSHSSSLTELVRLPHMPDSYTNARALNEACVNAGTAGLFPESAIDRIIAYQADPTLPETIPSASNPLVWAVNNESNANHDWFNVYYGQGMRNQDNIAFSGGSKKLGYYISAGQQYDKGELKIGNDSYQRYNTIAKFDINPVDWISFSSNSKYSNTYRTRPSCRPNGGYTGLFWYIARNYPTQYITDPNGHTSRISWIPFVRDGGKDNTSINDFSQRFTVKLTPLKDLTIDADYSFNVISTLNNYDSKTTYDYGVNNQPIIMTQTVPNFIRTTENIYLYNTLNIYSTYKFNFAGKNHASVMVGYQQERSNSNYLYGYNTNLVDQNLPVLNLATGAIPQVSGNIGRYATQGVFSRINYDFDNKYLLEINSRYDGTYKFAKNKRWGFFPSISLGWNLSNENFWQTLKQTVNLAKIRASYGVLGNQLTAAAYQDLALMGVSSNLGWIINNTRPSFVTAPNLINPDITWESSATQDLGIDLGLLKDKISFTGDIYKRYTFNQLGPSNAVPAVIGVSVLPNSNNMETTTKGWEVSLTWNDRIGKDFHYSITGLLFNYKTRVTKYNNPTRILTNPYTGQTVGEIWGFETVGLIQSQEAADSINTNHTQQAISGIPYKTGDISLLDQNGDGKITYGGNTVDDPGDRKIIGNSTPRYQFGLNLNAEWKGISFSMFWQGAMQRDLMLNGNLMWGFQALYAHTLTAPTLDYYRDAEATKTTGLGMNLNGFYPRPYNDQNMNNKNQITQTRYLQNAAYARLKNIQIGYSIPQRWLSKVKLQELFVYVSAENLMTITPLLKNFDPETANIGYNGTSGYSYPSSGVVTAGVNVKF